MNYLKPHAIIDKSEFPYSLIFKTGGGYIEIDEAIVDWIHGQEDMASRTAFKFSTTVCDFSIFFKEKEDALMVKMVWSDYRNIEDIVYEPTS